MSLTWGLEEYPKILSLLIQRRCAATKDPELAQSLTSTSFCLVMEANEN